MTQELKKSIAVVTTFNSRLYKEYAHRFIDTYNWPFDLFVYTEDNSYGFDLFKEVPKAKEFVERNSHRTFKSFHFDSVRFSYKVYAYTDFILNKNVNYDGLIYMDADSVFYKENSIKWMQDNVHKDNCISSYLGRDKMYSECGFLYFNLNHNYTKAFAQEIQDMYNNDTVFNLKEYHDCEVYDTIRRKYWTEHNVLCHNIGDGHDGHVQARSCLAELYDHTKGPRKRTGFSPERTVDTYR